ncbi:MAG: hypothetical protein PHX77_07575 [Candidatus Bipolaricaulis sp.]|nr:hypothetical protein [Candidatus Bipolaricaulis sp.]
MAIEFTFRITQDEIRVRDRETGFDRAFVNRVAVHEKPRIIVALGEDEEKVKARLGAWYLEHASEIRFATLFDAEGADRRYEIRVLEYLTRALHRQSQDSRRLKHIAAKLRNAFDYVLEIPGYEAFPEARRHALEEGIQAHMRVRRLVVNGTEVQIPVHRREAEHWLRRLLVWVAPVVATAIAYVAAPVSIMESRLTLFVYLLAIAFCVYYGGKVLWMLAARRLVPATYRLCMLQGLRHRLPAIDQWLARRIWGVTKTGPHT